ncbi:ImmA/IrrE family metallo-endopeptidase [Acidaminobacter hydrogenoformans]|uniref:IrrE N-terminal-like domain-containing protein n=1 Tax=Acidaminobacter hydrogenoformans DSM 2784 TaxID=1120920 RepID=A0A1G5S654_9FIRM|nr:ImmA/IrrE family metallo-endopeptidase [Acidaminobacter hydrogenoformans]SCZ81380.1 protein of unknown function [Acidaminobacter hydrogenoformans DSM 2784]
MKKVELSDLQLDHIIKLSRDLRRSVGYVGDVVIGYNVFSILDTLGIALLEYPIDSKNSKPAFSAAMIYSEENNERFAFIGLNTADYLDNQIFSIAHELYHFCTKTGSHLSRIESDNNQIEDMANRFAAEFLLPETCLKSLILEEFKQTSLEDISRNTLLRLIARLQCHWYLPYRSVVRRLYEISAITHEQLVEFYDINERDLNGEYGRLGQAIDQDTFIKLNDPTYKIGTSAKEIEIIIRNFEDHLIDEDKFAAALSLFNRTPEEFGFHINVSNEDIDEFEAFFSGEGNNV